MGRRKDKSFSTGGKRAVKELTKHLSMEKKEAEGAQNAYHQVRYFLLAGMSRRQVWRTFGPAQVENTIE